MKKLSLISITAMTMLLPDSVYATDATISNAGTSQTSTYAASGNNVTFTGDGTLEVNHGGSSTVGLDTLDISGNSIGHVNFTTNNSFLNIQGSIGSSNSKLRRLTLNNGSRITFNNEVNISDGVFTSGNGIGDVQFFGTNDENYAVNTDIGESGTAVGTLQIGSGIGTLSFSGDIFSAQTELQAGTTMHILNNNNTVSLGTLKVDQVNSVLILDTNADAATLDTNATSSSITIREGKDLTLSGNSDIRSGNTTNIYIDQFGTSTASLNSTGGTMTIHSGSKFNFDYSNASDLNIGSHTFVSANALTTSDCTGGAGSNVCNAVNFTDNSALLSATVTEVNETLVLTTALDEASTSLLGTEESDHVNYLLTGDLGSTIRAEMLKIQDQETLEKELDTLEEERNNMIQTVSLDISSKVQNIINYRMLALNYNYIGFSSGNKSNDRGSVWGEVLGGYYSQDERLNEEGYSSTMGGVVFGVDGVLKLSDLNLTVGVAGAYSNTNVKGDSFAKQNTDINSYHGTLYTNIVANNGMGLFNETSFTYGYNQYESSRRIKIGSIDENANSDYNGSQFIVKTALGYNFKIANKLFVSPNIGIKYAALLLEDYTETGAGDYGLEVKNELYDVTTTNVGMRVMGEIDTGKSDYKIFPQVSFDWLRNLDTEGREVKTRFIGGSTTTRNIGIDLHENLFNFGTQVNIENRNATSFILKYELQGGKDYLGHTGSIRYRLAF